MSSICIIRPANDPAATTLANMAALLNTIVAASTHSLVDLYGSAATRAAVEAQLSANRVIVFFGHGLKSRLQGMSTDLIDSTNVSKASGQIIIAIACWSAHTLAVQAVQQGIDAYLGFDEQFGCLRGDPDGQFGSAAIACIESILTGNDMAVAFSDMQQRFDSVFEFYKTGKGSGQTDSVLGWLLANWNKNHMRLHGNARATLASTPNAPPLQASGAASGADASAVALALFQRIKSLGIGDPDLDLWIATLTDDATQLANALNAGAHPDVRDIELMQRYRSFISQDPEGSKLLVNFLIQRGTPSPPV